jgi:flagellar motor switch protein FliG
MKTKKTIADIMKRTKHSVQNNFIKVSYSKNKQLMNFIKENFLFSILIF